MVAVRTIAELTESRSMVNHTYDVISRCDDLLAALSQSESAVRGFAISGDDKFLVSTGELSKETTADLQLLKRMTADNPGQQQRLLEAEELINRRLELLRETEEHRRTGGLEASVAVITQGEGRRVMDRIVKMFDTIEGQERLLLEQRLASSRKGVARAKTTMMVLTGLVFALLSAAYYLIASRREQQRRNAQQLGDINNRLQAILDGASETGIIATDLDGRITMFNTGAERMLGYLGVDVVGKRTVNTFHAPDELSRWAQEVSAGPETSSKGDFKALARQIDKDKRLDREWTLVKSDGSRITANASYTPLKNHSGEDTGYIVVAKDITDRKLAEIELRRLNRELATARDQALEASRLKSAFLANMSHELRTPLNGIIGFSEILIQEPIENLKDQLKPSLEKIHRSGRHLLNLINDILDLSKIEAGKMTLSPETFQVEAVVEEVETAVRPQVVKNGNTFAVNVGASAGKMTADPVRVRQVLLNLLSNAGKFTENGTITLDVSRSSDGAGDTIVFKVTDSGIGMNDDQVGRLFTEFTQADGSTTRKYGGTGLGLAISKRFCEMMGGGITVASELEKGSVFTATLPAETRIPTKPKLQRASAGAITVMPPTSQIRRRGSRIKVLVIDDDAHVLDIMSHFLDSEGAFVTLASSGIEGLALAKSEQPDLITLDVMMPDLDGWTVLSQLKDDPDTASIPVVVITMLDDRDMGFALGAADYLVKPVDRGRLHDLLVKLRDSGGQAGDILVVDDDAETRELLSRMVANESWTVRTASNGVQAMEQIRAAKPLAVLLDLMMPEMDGFQVVDLLHQDPELSDIPIIIVTARDLTQEDIKRLNGGVEKVLRKGDSSRAEILQHLQEVVTMVRESNA